MRRRTLGLVVLAGLALAHAAPTATPTQPPSGYRLVSSAVLACPSTSGAGQAATVLAATVVGPTVKAGAAVLRPVVPGPDLVRLAYPDEPVALLSVGTSQPPILMQAAGSWAPWSLAGIVSRQLSGSGEGLASTSCPAPSPDWWFTGAGSQIGRGAALLVSNPAQEPARFDINLYSGAGPVQALASKGIDLGPSATVRLRLDALAPGDDVLAINVRATRGRVVAAVRDVEVPRDDRPQGVDFIPPAQSPDTRLVVAGIPAGTGRRELALVNPGSQFATVIPRLLTEDGPEALPDLAAIAVPAGAVILVDLARVLEGRSGTLDLASDLPVTGGARAEWGAATREITWLAAVPLIGGPNPLGGAVAVPVGPGITSSVVVAAPDDQVRGTLTTMIAQSPDLDTFTGSSASAADGQTAEQGAQVVLPEGPTLTVTKQVTVAAGSQETIVVAGPGLPGASEPGLATVYWSSEADSARAAIAHLVLDPDVPLATGYPWWPVASSVPAVEVREDLGVLAPTG